MKFQILLEDTGTGPLDPARTVFSFTEADGIPMEKSKAATLYAKALAGLGVTPEMMDAAAKGPIAVVHVHGKQSPPSPPRPQSSFPSPPTDPSRN